MADISKDVLDQPPSSNGDPLELARLSRALDEARARSAALEAELAALKDAEATPYVRKLEARIEELKTRLTVQDKENRRLFEHLRWHWASYPWTVQNWEERDPASDPYGARQRALRSRLVEMLASPDAPQGDRRVTVVITSCKRHDLLEPTLASFFERNSHPIEKVIVVEDGDQAFAPEMTQRFAHQPMEWMHTGGRVGQVRAVDAAYSRVKTPYVFHVEDDWEFVRPGFIEASMPILEAEPLCLQVWIRGAPGPQSHQFEDHEQVTAGHTWRKVAKGHGGVWHGFSFNPGLRRLRDYRLLGGSYAARVESGLGAGGQPEAQLSELYASIGFFAAALWVDDGASFIMHRGGGRHVA